MRKRLMSCFLIIAILVSSMGMTGSAAFGLFKKNDLISERISIFEEACQEVDIMKMLKSINPEVGDPLRITLAVLESITDIDIEKCIDSFFDGIAEDELGFKVETKEFLESISFTDLKISKKKDTATVKCFINFVVRDESFKLDAKIKMIKKYDEWYINMIDVFPEKG